PAAPATYTLSLHDALPILDRQPAGAGPRLGQLTRPQAGAEGPTLLAECPPLSTRRRDCRLSATHQCSRVTVKPRCSSRRRMPASDRKSTRLNSSHVKISYA